MNDTKKMAKQLKGIFLLLRICSFF